MNPSLTYDQLFDEKKKSNNKPPIKGLSLFQEVITKEQEEELIKFIINTINKNDLNDAGTILKSRITKHFGYTFSAKTLRIDYDDPPPPISPSITKYLDSILSNLKLEFDYNQLTINTYNSKSGIGAHVDTHSAFTDYIIILSLLSPITFQLLHPTDPEIKYNLWLPSRSLLILEDEARYFYKHRIPNRKTDLSPDNLIIPRTNRISLTFRLINKEQKCECRFPSMCNIQNPESFHLPDRL